MRRRCAALLIILAIVIAPAAVGCGNQKTQSPPAFTVSSPPPPLPPMISPPAEPPPPISEPPPSPSPPAAPSRYPLSAAQAQQYVQAGVSVAGVLPNQLEVLVVKTTTTTYEQKTVDEEVCADEYDSYEDKYVYKCRYKPVEKDVPVETTVYAVWNGGVRTEYPNVYGAMSAAIGLGATAFRQAS